MGITSCWSWLYFIHTSRGFRSLAAWSLQGEEVGKNLDDGKGPSPVGRRTFRRGTEKLNIRLVEYVLLGIFHGTTLGDGEVLYILALVIKKYRD